jgi:hypothetical protein
MRRRELVATLGLGSTLTLAGCMAGYHGADETGGAKDSGAVQAPTLAQQGFPTTVCDEKLKPGGIVAIGDPAFGSIAEWPDDPDGYRPMTDDRTIIGLTVDGAARAYPLTVLNVHEIVNDDFGGPVIVTYCPLCRSGMVADRRVNGTPATFDVSGLLWKPPGIYTAASEKDGRVFSDRDEGVSNTGNLVMYDDQTGSYWSQMLAQAICGPQRESRLTIRASSVTTLGEWRTAYPETEVLLPPPASTLVDPPVTG